MKKTVSGILVMLSLLVTSAFAQKPAVVISNEPGWHKIGEINASLKQEVESISIHGADKFNAIKLMVKDAPLNIERLEVIYESGYMEEINVRNELKAGAETRTIDLKRPNEELKKVTFTYKTLPNYTGEKAQVELYGLKGKNNSPSTSYNESKEEVKDRAENTGNDVKNTAEKVGDKASEIAAKGAAEIKDQVYEEKVGPDGQTIYMDNNAKYYYINNEGKKVYVSKAELKDKSK